MIIIEARVVVHVKRVTKAPEMLSESIDPELDSVESCATNGRL